MGTASNPGHFTYESRDMTAKDAATCIRQATTLVEAARSRALIA
jgi:hypothetical protein